MPAASAPEAPLPRVERRSLRPPYWIVAPTLVWDSEAHCVCQPGSVAHEEHARPGAGASAHLNPACLHSTLANDCGGYEALRLRLEAARARKDEQLVAARDAQARAMVTGDYPTASQLQPLRLTQATAIDKLTADPGAWRSCRDRHYARGGAAPGELRRAVYTALAGHSGAP